MNPKYGKACKLIEILALYFQGVNPPFKR